MDDPEPSLYLLGVAICLLLLALTTAADAAFTAIGRHRLAALRSQGKPRAQRAVTYLLDDPYRFKATIIFLNAVVTVTATALTLALTVTMPLYGRILALGGLIIAMLLTSEVAPKAVAIRNPDRTAALLAGPLNLVATILWPVINVINILTRPIFALISGRDAPRAPLVTEEELRHMVNIGEEEGLIEEEERAMIEGIFDFGDTLIREIMVPRLDIVALDIEASLSEALDVVIARGHSRIPVYEESLDTIIGILYAKDLIPTLRDGKPHAAIRDLMRRPIFVPETMKVNALLEELQHRRVHMAIIVDEYGGTAGLATIEDLIEQIVGEIQDEYDTEEPSIQPVGEFAYNVDARVPIDDISELFAIDLVSEGADRIGGLVSERLGRIPRAGDVLELDAVTITVLTVKGVRAQRLQIHGRILQHAEPHNEYALIQSRVHEPA
ncbi:MAG: HlyC/CorC family transporter [Oscillochloris sp.]|nr:HlyC/CorC family transporter [Oscillochloris sp.]